MEKWYVGIDPLGSFLVKKRWLERVRKLLKSARRLKFSAVVNYVKKEISGRFTTVVASLRSPNVRDALFSHIARPRGIVHPTF